MPCRHVARSIDDMAPADIAALVTAYARLDYSPGAVLFDSLAARVRLTAMWVQGTLAFDRV